MDTIKRIIDEKDPNRVKAWLIELHYRLLEAKEKIKVLRDQLEVELSTHDYFKERYDYQQRLADLRLVIAIAAIVETVVILVVLR